jgi:tripartite-type tricarboxylate transporter receptor subunit TctC
VAKVNAAVVASLKTKETADKLALLGASPVGSSPAEFAEFVKLELDRWEKLIKPLNIALD